MNFDNLLNQHIPVVFRNGCLRVLARGIQIIAQHTDKNWAIRVSEQNGIMLKVGAHEVMQGAAHFILDRASIPSVLRAQRYLKFSQTKDYLGNVNSPGYYPSNPGTEACDTEIEYTETLFNQLSSSFTKAVVRAAKTKTHPSNRKTHSSEFVEYLREVTGIDIRPPGFANTSESTRKLGQQLIEGAAQKRLATIYAHDPNARRQCLERYGTTCCVCEKSMEDIYGEIGKDVIHVHHVIPISARKGEYHVNPAQALRPVCPNCHAVIHSKKPPYSLEEVRKAFMEAKTTS